MGLMFLLMNFKVLFPLAAVCFICLLQVRSSDMVSPRYLVFLCGLKSYAMKFVVKDNWILFLSYSNDLTFIWVEGHEPLSLPCFEF